MASCRLEECCDNETCLIREACVAGRDKFEPGRCLTTLLVASGSVWGVCMALAAEARTMRRLPRLPHLVFSRPLEHFVDCGVPSGSAHARRPVPLARSRSLGKMMFLLQEDGWRQEVSAEVIPGRNRRD